jgi:hypothetical protein
MGSRGLADRTSAMVTDRIGFPLQCSARPVPRGTKAIRAFSFAASRGLLVCLFDSLLGWFVCVARRSRSSGLGDKSLVRSRHFTACQSAAQRSTAPECFRRWAAACIVAIGPLGRAAPHCSGRAKLRAAVRRSPAVLPPQSHAVRARPGRSALRCTAYGIQCRQCCDVLSHRRVDLFAASADQTEDRRAFA